MPRSSKSRPAAAGGAAGQSAAYQISEEFATLAAAMSDAHMTGKSAKYTSSIANVSRDFGTAPERGGCDCAQCLRKSGPLLSDMQETIRDLTNLLVDEGESDVISEDADPSQSSADSEITTQTATVTKPSRHLAERFYQAAVEDPEPDQLNALLTASGENGVEVPDVAECLALAVAQRGHANIIKVLADHGASFQKPDFSRGGPPLMHAANNGHTATVSELLKHGANPEATDRLGQTALMVAVFSDRHQAAEVLIKEGNADLNAEDSMGRTALSHAAKYGSTDCMNLLANCHADVLHRDDDGKTPVQIAEESAITRTETITALKRYQQLQIIRLRCERKKQKETAQPLQLTPEEQAAAQAKSDAVAEALMAQERAEQEKAKAKKVKKKAKPKAVLTPMVNGTLAASDPAAKAAEPQHTASSARQDLPESDHKKQSNSSPDQHGAQPKAADATCHITTVQSGRHDSPSKDGAQELAADKPVSDTSPVDPPESSASQHPVIQSESSSVEHPVISSDSLAAQQAATPSEFLEPPVIQPDTSTSEQLVTPAESSGPQHRISPPAPSSASAQPAEHVKPPSELPSAPHAAAAAATASAGDTHPQPSSSSQAAAATAPVSHGSSPGPPTARRSQPSVSQQAFGGKLKAALAPKPKPRAAGHGHGPASDPLAFGAAQPAPSPPSSSRAQQTGSTSSPALIAAGLGPAADSATASASDATAVFPPAGSSASEPDTSVSASQSTVDAGADLKRSASTGNNADQFQASTTQSSAPHSSSSRAASLPGSRQASPAQASKGLPSPLDILLPSTATSTADQTGTTTSTAAAEPQEDGASSPSHSVNSPVEQSMPPGLPPVRRKPPGLPSPVPPGLPSPHEEAAEAPVASYESWGASVDESEASSLSHSPTRGDQVSTTSSQFGDERDHLPSMEQRLKVSMSRVTGDNKPIDPDDPQNKPLLDRLRKEAEQQYAQELRHLKGKTRALQKQEAARLAREREQQIKQEAQHKARQEAKLAELQALAEQQRVPWDPSAEGPKPKGPAKRNGPAAVDRSNGIAHGPASANNRTNGPASDAGSEYETEVAPILRQAPKQWPAPSARPAPAPQAVAERRPGPSAAGNNGLAPLTGPPVGQLVRPSARVLQPDRGPARNYNPPAANPLAFLGQVGLKAAPKRNPDPLAFGVGLPPGVVFRQQVDKLCKEIEDTKGLPPQQQQAQQERLRHELQALLNKPLKDRPPVPHAGELLQVLDSALEAHELLASAEASPAKTAPLEQAIQTGRNCRLLDRALLREADVKLRERKKAQLAHPALLPWQQGTQAPAYAPPPQSAPQYVPQQYTPPQAVSQAMPRPHSASQLDAQHDRPTPSYMPHQQPQQQQRLPQPSAPLQYAPQPTSSQQYASQRQVPQYAPQSAVTSSSGSHQGSPLQFMLQPAAAAQQDRRKPAVYTPLFQEPEQNGLQTAEPAAPQRKAPQYMPQQARPAVPQRDLPQQYMPQQPDSATGQRQAPQYAPQQAVVPSSGSQQGSPLQYMPQQLQPAAHTADPAAAPPRKAPQQYLPQFAPPPAVTPRDPRPSPQQTPASSEQPPVEQKEAQQPLPQWLAAATSGHLRAQQQQAPIPGPAGRAQADQQSQPEPITGANARQAVLAAKGPPPGMPAPPLGGLNVAPAAAAVKPQNRSDPAAAQKPPSDDGSIDSAPARTAADRSDVQSAGNHGNKAAGENQDDCVVCWAHEKNMVCIPCGHVAMCKSCSQAVLKKSGLCPVCRAKIVQVFQLYRT